MKVLVIGDTLLDEYVYGSVDRVSPEAPVPVFDLEKTDDVRLGGAANVAANISSLIKYNIPVDYYGLCNSFVIEALKQYDVRAFGEYVPSKRILTKTRYVGNGQQLLRVDNKKEYDVPDINNLYNYGDINLNNYDVVVVSDYGKGTINDVSLWDKLILFEGMIFFDFKYPVDLTFLNSLLHSRSEYIWFKCNQKESESLISSATGIYSEIEDSKNCSFVVTAGSDGSYTKTQNRPWSKVSKSKRDSVVDIVGAGDVYLAAMVVYVAEKKMKGEPISDKQMAGFANRVASKSTKYFGTTVMKWEDV